MMTILLGAPVVSVLLLAGRLDEAWARIETVEELARIDGGPYGLASMGSLRSMLLSDRGEVEAAEAAAHAAIKAKK